MNEAIIYLTRKFGLSRIYAMIYILNDKSCNSGFYPDCYFNVSAKSQGMSDVTHFHPWSGITSSEEIDLQTFLTKVLRMEAKRYSHSEAARLDHLRLNHTAWGK